MESITIVKVPEEVAAYIENVREAADQNKKSLGFLPSSVFSDYARRGRLWVAKGADGGFLGHLLFDHKYPKATVIQMYCSPSARRAGVASALLRALKSTLTIESYLCIKATVAEDLAEANTFWERNGFPIQARKRGGQTTGRTLVVRVHELNVPQLFGRSGLDVNGSDSLGLDRVVGSAPPMYLVDLNILFDIVKRREQHDLAARLFHSAHSGECRLAISDEMHRELHRQANDPKTDSMLCLIDSLPWVQLPQSAEADKVLKSVARMVFPEKRYPEQLSENDRSDVRHVSTAILCRLGGFVTRDQRILRAAAQIEGMYKVQVLSPMDFGILDSSHGQSMELEIGHQNRIQIAPYSASHCEQVRRLLLDYAVSPEDILRHWLPRGAVDISSVTLVAMIDGVVVGYSCSSKAEPRTRCAMIRAVIDERIPNVEDVGRALLRRALRVDGAAGTAMLDLSIPERQSTLRQLAYLEGFRAPSAGGGMLKVVARELVLAENWARFRSCIAKLADVRLPKEVPEWVSHQHPVEVVCPDGNRRFIRLDALETLLSPVLFALRGRPAVVVPIRPKYSDALLGASRQLSLAPMMQLETNVNRRYLADSRSITRYTKGGLVLFYESGGGRGEKSIVAVARVLDVYLIQRDQVDEESLKGSVLDVGTINEIGSAGSKSVCVFDNLIAFDRPVGLDRLRAIGLRPSSLITAYKLTEVQLKEILSDGFISPDE